MPLSAKDVRFTARRNGDGDPLLYPRLLKDRAILASIDVALQYFETMIGDERRALDPEALVHFFGDYKVARGMVASIGRAYRYRTPSVEELVTRTAWRRLQRVGLDRPGAFRALIWDEANADRSGFLDGLRRPSVVGALEGRYGLKAGQLDRLLALDAPEHAILTRLGAAPRPADVLAEYRRSVVAALLANAERVELTLGRGAGAYLERIGALAEIERVEIDLVAETGGGARVAVRGRPDAFGSWARQGRRVARFVARLLERVGGQVEDGSASIVTRSRRARLRLTGDTLEALLPRADGSARPAASVQRRGAARNGAVGTSPASSQAGRAGRWESAARPSDGWDAPDGWDDRAVAEAIGPGQGSSPGWLVRRDPEPRAWEAGLLVPDLLVRPAGRDATAGVLVCLVRTLAQAERLASLLPDMRGGEPLLFAGPGVLTEPIRAGGGWTMELEQPALAPIVAVVATRALASAPLAEERPLGRPGGRRPTRVA